MSAWDFEQIKKDALAQIENAGNLQELEAVRVQYLGRNGVITQIFSNLAGLPASEKPLVGKNANELKGKVADRINLRREDIEKSREDKSAAAPLDVTIPGVAREVGHKHIITQTIEEICDIFVSLGFVVQQGPEIETEFNNFTALNIPVDHPSRDAFDTFYLQAPDPKRKGRNLLLRSHTSPGQIRIMEKYKPPLAVVVPGRVYRPDAVDASHSFMFHQIEGLLVDKEVRFSDLKGMLSVFCKRFFGDNIEMRFRPHFFPFTEPSAEVDIRWHKGKKAWLEIMGCGMVHPKVFEAVRYPKGKYTGLAFGLGVERMVMLKYGIKDIRTFFENDLRFLRQF